MRFSLFIFIRNSHYAIISSFIFLYGHILRCEYTVIFFIFVFAIYFCVGFLSVLLQIQVLFVSQS